MEEGDENTRMIGGKLKIYKRHIDRIPSIKIKAFIFDLPSIL